MTQRKHQAAAASLLLAAAFNVQAAELLARSVLPADTFAPGPTSGRFTNGANGFTTPFVDEQPVQGFSAVLNGPRKGTYLVMMDNGFGAKNNSADTLLRVFGVKPNFTTGVVAPVSIRNGSTEAAFNESTYMTLSDPFRKVAFSIVADGNNFPDAGVSVPGAIPVDKVIKDGRLLTGGDFDIESFRRMPDGTFWFGEEFGPYLLHTDAKGRLIDAPIPLPNFKSFPSVIGGTVVNALVQSPQNPQLDGTAGANLPGSGGFEGMALNISGTRLYALLEKAINGDAVRNRLWINEFNPHARKYTGRMFGYLMDAPNNAIGDFTALTDTEFLIIERDGGQGNASDSRFTNPARFKKIFRINLTRVDADGNLIKEEVADLMNIYDPRDIAGDGTANTVFTFPFVTIEDVLVVNHNTLLVINDNNFPFSSGRTFGVADNNEFILIQTAPLTRQRPICYVTGPLAPEWSYEEN